MKKIAWMLCLTFLLSLLCACGNQEAELKVPTNFYYINKDISYNSPSGVISAEVREGVSYYGNLTVFLRDYLLGPESSDLQSYIPAGTELLSCTLHGDEATLKFNNAFSKLNGSRLTIVSSAILMSAHDFANINALTIRIENGRLDDKDELRITMDSLVLLDSVQMNIK